MASRKHTQKVSIGPKFSAFSILNTCGVVLTAISPVGKTSEQFRDLQMGLQRLQFRSYLSVPEPKNGTEILTNVDEINAAVQVVVF